MPFLIDGHNLIGQTPGLHLSDPEDEQKLIQLLRAYLARTRKKGTVVFDQGQPGAPARRSNAMLEVRFARLPRTADDVILERLRTEKNPRGLVLVSSDQQLVHAARRAGASVIPPAVFARSLLARQATSRKDEGRLSPEEIEAWEAEFRGARKKRAG